MTNETSPTNPPCKVCGLPVRGPHADACYFSAHGIEHERALERELGRSGNLYRMSEVVTAVEAFEQGIRYAQETELRPLRAKLGEAIAALNFYLERTSL